MGLGSLFEDIFYSARIGTRKPERGFFDFVDHRIGSQSEPPLFFDDTPKVVEGARAAGWEAVLFNTIDDFLVHPWIAARLSQ
jgi:putative hydrolase of the HAD superfamily